jgi:hypothetical protein
MTSDEKRSRITVVLEIADTHALAGMSARWRRYVEIRRTPLRRKT